MSQVLKQYYIYHRKKTHKDKSNSFFWSILNVCLPVDKVEVESSALIIRGICVGKEMARLFGCNVLAVVCLECH